jgi:thiamine biosynthesis lipoprotein
VGAAVTRRALLLLLGGALALPVSARAQATGEARAYPFTAQAMGTLVTVTIWSEDMGLAGRGAKAVFDEFARLDQMMSNWVEDNELSKLNRGAGSFVTVDRELFDLIAFSKKQNGPTRGSFDLTVGAFQGLWKFDEDKDGTIPKEKDVRARLKLIGWDKVDIRARGRKIRLEKKGMKLTLGGLAKGYAVDRAVAILRDMGLKNFIVQAGGDLYASGRKGDNPWRVGIRDPRGPREDSFAVVEVEDATFSTSGDYERSVVIGDKRYHHILDPKTGRPADRCRSVTIRAKNALLAEVWSKAVFVLGAEEGMKLLAKQGDLEAVIVDKNNQVHISDGLRDKVKILHPPGDGP